MTKHCFFALLSIMICICFCACGEEDSPKDATGKYKLSDKGEAIIDDVPFSSDTAADNNRVMYEIFVGSFSDSNGDGIGDLRGIINRLDYLNDGDPASGKSLGVEGLWLTPIFTSSSYHKYDVTDYYSVDPSFGTENDLWELIERCHDRGMIVILDLPINHTSTGSSYFNSFLAAHRTGDTANKYYNFYSFIREGESAPSGRRFNKLGTTSDSYECNFDNGMPELNFDSDDVRAEVLNIAKHYLELGIDGFRFDAARYIYFGETGKNVEFWKWYVSELKKIKPDVYTVGEVWDSDATVKMYYPALDCFDFTGSGVSGIIANTAKGGDATRYTNYVSNYLNVQKDRSDAMYMPFIANHDMDRSAGFLTVASGQARVAANLYLLTPGSPFIYYGEEIGLKGSRGGENTDANRRLAMFWGDGDTITDPTGATYASSKQTNGSVSELLGDGNSLYSHYKKLIMIRRANPEIARGTYVSLKIDDSEIGGFTSTLNGSSVCVLHNTTPGSTLSVDLSKYTDLTFNAISAVAGDGEATLEGTVITIGPQTSVVLR